MFIDTKLYLNSFKLYNKHAVQAKGINYVSLQAKCCGDID